MKKYILDLKVCSVEKLHSRYVLLKLTQDEPLPEMHPGQFVEVSVSDSPTTFLRRPISIHYVDRARNELWLLVALVGEGTRHMGTLQVGDTLNCVLPLGNGFTMNDAANSHPLLVGGGVGTAPLLYYGQQLKEAGVEPTFLLGARSVADLLQLDEFKNMVVSF